MSAQASPAPVSAAYQHAIARGAIVHDASQLAAARRLDAVAAGAVPSLIGRLFGRRRAAGAYLWGGVGRGKTFLMDLLYAHAPAPRRLRLHFHELLKDAERAAARNGNALDFWARDLAARHDLVCIDELHVGDVVEALFVGRLLESLMDSGVALCITSNQAPGALYAGGLNRHYLLPAIALIESRLDVVAIDAGADYRRRAAATCHIDARDPAAAGRMAALFQRFEGGTGRAGEVIAGGCRLPCVRQGDSVAWFDFAELCGGYRSTRDYLAIAGRYPVVLLEGVPALTEGMGAAARRLIWLVDVCYDHHVALLVAAAAAPDALYAADRSGDFQRAASRLAQMGSEVWISAARAAWRPAAQPAVCA